MARQAGPRRAVTLTNRAWGGGRIMPGGRPPSFKSFTCPNCQALYHIVKVEVGSATRHMRRCQLVPRLLRPECHTVPVPISVRLHWTARSMRGSSRCQSVSS